MRTDQHYEEVVAAFLMSAWGSRPMPGFVPRESPSTRHSVSVVRHS